MAKLGFNDSFDSDPDEHPALQAWRQLQPAATTPTRIDTLDGKPPVAGRQLKEIVCRLVGVGAPDSTVIGKRCRREDGVTENLIYQGILRDLPVPNLEFYGMVEERDGDYCWLFLQDAGENVYYPDLEDHQLLGAQWLALMHCSSATLTRPKGARDKGLDGYLTRLRLVHQSLLQALNEQAVHPGELVQLETALRQCEQLEVHWNQVREMCERLPETLVHGDYVAKNLRVKRSQTGTVLMAFDWEEAGWGTPARDLAHVIPESYWAAASVHWPEVTLRTIRTSAAAGLILQSIDAIYWALKSVHYGWARHLRRHLTVYNTWLSEAMVSADLGMNLKRE